ncbi:MAG: PAS domain-containing protein [Candidatus Rokubacteria bacterium]|nr:PAS domain-containing protein [Candidatus Rokubacteria bacterium]MBI2490704.1 PAS domain-containing protein [Candidatus Rokubacteria bacterium]MBI4253431.1 PAS domain-containing protein [Candidatus Rokubacteria bacterium]MBI4629491.1 PAS domain-containing protein [Candidatus Rokubacteria bacterium]
MTETLTRMFDRLALHVGGARVLALPLLRTLAVLAALAWLLLAPAPFQESQALLLATLGFLVYSTAVEAALWTRPAATLRLNFYVLLLDQLFALVLIALTGGARSGLYLALPLIAALQSYYYGIRRGVAVACVSAAAYLAVVWPTIVGLEIPNVAMRLIVLLGTAVSVGVLAEIEQRERLRGATLSAEILDRERFIQSVVDNLSEGVFALDADGRIVAWNRAMETRYDVPAAEVTGRRYFECFPAAAREPWSQSLGRLLRGEIEEFAEEGVDHQSLRTGMVVQNIKGRLLREGARPAGAVLLVEDITERVGIERAARQAEKLAALGTLAAGLAHELNNPIGVISTRAELMQLDAETRPLPADVREDLHVIHRHAQRVARIAQGLLSFSRHSSGAHGRVDLNRLVDETLLLIEKQIVRDGIALRRALAPTLPPVWGDANALQQVVMNLLTNARDAVRKGGEIAIETAPAAEPPGGVRLVVRDTGPGIPPEDLPRIFDPFFTTKAEGTGLGLSISYGIVREHRGTVDVQSRPGEGTTFVLTFRGAGDGELA